MEEMTEKELITVLIDKSQIYNGSRRQITT